MNLIERCEAKYREITSQPAYDATHANLWRALIDSARESASVLKEEPTRTEGVVPMDETHQAYRDTWEIENVVGDLRAHMTDRNARQILVEELERIERAMDDLAVIVADLRERRERQVATMTRHLQAAE